MISIWFCLRWGAKLPSLPPPCPGPLPLSPLHCLLMPFPSLPQFLSMCAIQKPEPYVLLYERKWLAYFHFSLPLSFWVSVAASYFSPQIKTVVSRRSGQDIQADFIFRNGTQGITFMGNQHFSNNLLPTCLDGMWAGGGSYEPRALLLGGRGIVAMRQSIPWGPVLCSWLFCNGRI